MLHPIDIITADGRLTGQKSNPEEANNKGLWTQGVHVILYTAAGDVLVQKRSLAVKQQPGRLEIGVGGYVDSGETPEQAALREVKEETNIAISASQLRPISVTRYNHRWKYGRRQKIGRVVICSFACQLDESHVNHISPQRGEVAWIGFVPLRRVRLLIRRHRLKNLGVLSSTYAYYRKLVAAIS